LKKGPLSLCVGFCVGVKKKFFCCEKNFFCGFVSFNLVIFLKKMG